MNPYRFALLGLLIVGCGNPKAQDREYATSGSREADQRAEQRVARDQQLRGESAGAGSETTTVIGGEKAEDDTLYARVGGEAGVKLIVDDWMKRVLADPRVNWERKGQTKGGFLGMNQDSAEWQATPANVERVKKHMAQFFALSTGGPSEYQGTDFGPRYRGLGISNPEFDAAIGDLKATLDSLGIGVQEQKELIAIMETTRVQVVEKR